MLKNLNEQASLIERRLNTSGPVQVGFPLFPTQEYHDPFSAKLKNRGMLHKLSAHVKSSNRNILLEIGPKVGTDIQNLQTIYETKVGFQHKKHPVLTKELAFTELPLVPSMAWRLEDRVFLEDLYRGETPKRKADDHRFKSEHPAYLETCRRKLLGDVGPGFPTVYQTFRTNLRGVPTQVVVEDYVPSTFGAQLLLCEPMSPRQVMGIIFQVVFALAAAQTALGFEHTNLTLDAIGLAPTTNRFLWFHHGGLTFRVPTYGHIVQLRNLGQSRCRVLESGKKTPNFNQDLHTLAKSGGKTILENMQPKHRRLKKMLTDWKRVCENDKVPSHQVSHTCYPKYQLKRFAPMFSTRSVPPEETLHRL